MPAPRYLVVTADDFGIGPATSQGILELARRGIVTCTVLLVNSPHATAAVHAWRRENLPLEVGWHPCLTLDEPILPAHKAPSLVDENGRFWRLGRFMRRLAARQIRTDEIEAELRAQYNRFREIVGRPPTVVNSHHHVQVFPPVGEILLRILCGRGALPYVRRIREPWRALTRVPGARLKRSFLSWLGRRDAALQRAAGFPGNDWLAGVTDPPCVADPDFLVRWLARVPGRIVELTCHPGHLDTTLIGRDCTTTDGQLQRRVHEFHRLQEPTFREACARAGFTLIAPTALACIPTGTIAHAA